MTIYQRYVLHKAFCICIATYGRQLRI